MGFWPVNYILVDLRKKVKFSRGGVWGGKEQRSLLFRYKARTIKVINDMYSLVDTSFQLDVLDDGVV